MLHVAELHFAQELFAQAPAGDVRVQQELAFNVVPHLFAQPLAALLELLAQTPLRDGVAALQVPEFALQVREPHFLHDAAGVEALLCEHLDFL